MLLSSLICLQDILNLIYLTISHIFQVLHISHDTLPILFGTPRLSSYLPHPRSLFFLFLPKFGNPIFLMILLPIFSASIKNPKFFLIFLLTLKPIPLNLKFHPFLLDNHISDFLFEFFLFLFKLFDLHL